RLSSEQRRLYEENLIHYWGMKSAIETAVEEAIETAVEGKQIEIAKSLLQTPLSNEEIAKHTGLTTTQIEKLRKEMKK
ncbi:MAG: transposase, partial [Cytophagales bacterium]